MHLLFWYRYVVGKLSINHSSRSYDEIHLEFNLRLIGLLRAIGPGSLGS